MDMPVAVQAIFISLALLIIFLLLTIIAIYIFQGICFTKAGEADGIPNPWLSWIPYGNYYIMYKLAGMSYHWIWLLVALIPVAIITSITLQIEALHGVYLIFNIIYLGILITNWVVSIIALVKIGNKFNVHIAISILSFLIPFVIFAYYIIVYKNAKNIILNKSYNLNQVNM